MSFEILCKKRVLEQVLALGPAHRVLLHQHLDETPRLLRQLHRVVYPVFVNLSYPTLTLIIFYIIYLRFSPSNGTLPVSISYVSTPMHHTSTAVS